MISFAVFLLLACAGVLACVVIAWAARGTRAEESRRWVAGLPDLLLYASMIDDGILLLQDGALMATWRYAGPDLGSVTHEEMASLGERLNSVLKLGTGWLVHCNAIRSEVSEYARQGAFPDSVTSLIDDECRAQFKSSPRPATAAVYFSAPNLSRICLNGSLRRADTLWPHPRDAPLGEVDDVRAFGIQELVTR